MRIKLLLTVFLTSFLVLHPFHVSVTDIVHNPKTESLQISQRIFIDDLEEGLKKFHDLAYIDTYNPDDPERLDSLIDLYLHDKFFVRVDGQDFDFNYLGSEVESDARWCYFEVEGVANLKEAEVTNVVLMEVFDDQQNIIHFKVNDKLKSYKLDKDDKYTVFKF